MAGKCECWKDVGPGESYVCFCESGSENPPSYEEVFPDESEDQGQTPDEDQAQRTRTRHNKRTDPAE